MIFVQFRKIYEFIFQQELMRFMRAPFLESLLLVFDNCLFQSNFKIWGDVKPGRIGNMSLHSRHIHDGIITAVQNEAEIFALSPLIQQIRGEKTHEESSKDNCRYLADKSKKEVEKSARVFFFKF